MRRPPADRAALTVRGLVDATGLSLAAGASGASAHVRWVHITELRDPTPWLSGSELLLTTGIQLTTEREQREFVRLLKRSGLAGLGFGTGFDHDELPEALLDQASELDFPLFEVPYQMPFIAITEKAFTRIVNEGYETLRSGAEIHRRLERLVLEERGLDEVVHALATAIGGAVLVLDTRGETIASSAPWRELPAEALAPLRADVASRIGAGAVPVAPFEPDHPTIAGRALALPVVTHGGQLPQAWLVALSGVSVDASDGSGRGTRASPAVDDFQRLILQQAVTVVALEMMRLRVARDTERRLAGDVLAEALTGRLEPDELQRRLRPFGISSRAAVVVFALDDPGAGAHVLDRVASEERVGALVAMRDRLLCTVLDVAETDSMAWATRARSELETKVGPARAAVSRDAPVAELRRSFHEARCALEAQALSNGSAPEVGSYQDLGAFQLLLSLQDDEALNLYCDSLLGPLENSSGDYGDELIRSLEAFIEHNGQWERAARELFCHRHTLRYRIHRVEELTGRDLTRARDRIEFWLALRGRELTR
jgi:PucR family transcriptional regulator, purine catabolism regulatory protein